MGLQPEHLQALTRRMADLSNQGEQVAHLLEGIPQRMLELKERGEQAILTIEDIPERMQQIADANRARSGSVMQRQQVMITETTTEQDPPLALMPREARGEAPPQAGALVLQNANEDPLLTDQEPSRRGRRRSSMQSLSAPASRAQTRRSMRDPATIERSRFLTYDDN